MPHISEQQSSPDVGLQANISHANNLSYDIIFYLDMPKIIFGVGREEVSPKCNMVWGSWINYPTKFLIREIDTFIITSNHDLIIKYNCSCTLCLFFLFTTLILISHILSVLSLKMFYLIIIVASDTLPKLWPASEFFFVFLIMGLTILFAIGGSIFASLCSVISASKSISVKSCFFHLFVSFNILSFTIVKISLSLVVELFKIIINVSQLSGKKFSKINARTSSSRSNFIGANWFRIS